MTNEQVVELGRVLRNYIDAENEKIVDLVIGFERTRSGERDAIVERIRVLSETVNDLVTITIRLIADQGPDPSATQPASPAEIGAWMSQPYLADLPEDVLTGQGSVEDDEELQEWLNAPAGNVRWLGREANDFTWALPWWRRLARWIYQGPKIEEDGNV